jgi:hypothetical protein
MLKLSLEWPAKSYRSQYLLGELLGEMYWIVCQHLFYNKCLTLIGGGGTGIRTLGGLSPSSVFKTGAFDHSATPPTGLT